VVGLNATVHTNRRQIAADDFFLDLFESALDDGEIITKISSPTLSVPAAPSFPAQRHAMPLSAFSSPSPGPARALR
jgi:carbon-monoxide dehydrogenase medium subunit